MDIVNWDYLKKGLLVRQTVENPEDLVLLAANTTYKKRGDLFQSYTVPVSALAQATAQGLQGVITNNSNLTVDNTIIGNSNQLSWTGNSTYTIAPDSNFLVDMGSTRIDVNSDSVAIINDADAYNSVSVDYKGVYITTPEVSSAQNGYVPTLLNNASGEIEYKPIQGIPISVVSEQTIIANSGFNPINNLSIPVVTGKSYRFSVYLLYSLAPTANSAWGVRTTYSGLFIRDGYFVTWRTAASAPVTAYSDLITGSPGYGSGSPSSGTGVAIIEGTLSNAQADDFVSVVGGITSSNPGDILGVFAGSSLTYYEI